MGRIFAGVLIGYPLESLNPGDGIGSLFGYLTFVILGMSLGDPLGSLIEFVWHINWCGPCLGTCKFL